MTSHHSNDPSLNNDLATAMKRGMRRLANGVGILSTINAQGEPHGMTVTAFNSLSDQPPSLLVCVNRLTASFNALHDSRQFSINILNARQSDISNAFAFSDEGKSRFSQGQWLHRKPFAPLYLQDALASFFCSCDQFIDYGSHSVVIGLVEEVITSEVEKKPLIYFDANYCGVGELKE